MRRMFEPTPSIRAPQCDEEAAEILDVGLAGGVPHDRLAPGEHRGHDRVLRAHHRRLVEVQALAHEAVAGQLVGAVQRHVGTELGEGVDVGVQASAADHVPSRRGHDHAAEAREQRAGEQERCADLPAQVGVEIGLRDPRGIDADVVRPRPLGVRADVLQQLHHRLHVSDARHVRQAHLVGGEHGGGEDRQRAVLVPGRANGAGERATALDHERQHEAGGIVPSPWT